MILLIVPSRGRPHNAVELIKTWRATTEGKSELRFYVDSDDPTAYQYPEEFTSIGEPGRLVGITNRIAVANTSYYKMFGSIGDDHRFESAGWETKLLRALDKLGGRGVVYGDDGVHGENLCTAFFISANVVKALGYMIFPGLEHLYADNFALELGKAMRKLTYLPDVKIAHHHPIAKKAAWDATYEIGNNPGVWDRDSKAFADWQDNYKDLDVIKALCS